MIDMNKEGADLTLVDVTAQAYGIEVEGGKMSVIIPSNTERPDKKSKQYSTSYDNQTSIEIVIYEGDNADVKDNKKLGSFQIPNLPQKQAGQVVVNVFFRIDTNGTLTVECTGDAG